MYLDLEGKTLAELREEAKKLGIKRVTGVKKDELVKSIKIAIHRKRRKRLRKKILSLLFPKGTKAKACLK